MISKHQSVIFKPYRNILLTSLMSRKTNLVFIGSWLIPEAKRMLYSFFIFSCKIYANRCDPNNSKILSYKHLNVRLLCTVCLARNSALLAVFFFFFFYRYLLENCAKIHQVFPTILRFRKTHTFFCKSFIKIARLRPKFRWQTQISP